MNIANISNFIVYGTDFQIFMFFKIKVAFTSIRTYIDKNHWFVM